MTSPKCVFYLTWLVLVKMGQMTILSSSVHQESGFISANVGNNITLHCSYKGDEEKWFYWYKQSLGQKPRLISSFYMFDNKASFYDEFKNNSRFTFDKKNGKMHLSISDLRISDSATYYCVRMYAYMFEFAEGITVSVKGSGLNIPVLVHQSTSETIQPGGSVSLNCTVHTGTCDGEHSVYWFKNSEESHPGLIYTQGGRNDQCEKKPNTQAHTCVYNLAMKTLNLSHAETYYCAVASCGNIVFGNGTKLNLDNDDADDFVLVCVLIGALAFTTILNVLLVFLLYIIRERNSCHCRAASTLNAEGFKTEVDLHYAALRVKKDSRLRRQRDDTEDKCVYSSVKH